MPDADGRPSKRPGKIFFFGAILLVFLLAAGIVFAYHFTSPGYLITLLASDNVQKRRWAADQLVLKGPYSGKFALDVALDRKYGQEARRLAIFILGEIRYKEAEPRLLSFFREEDEVLSGQAAYALGRIGDPAMARELLSAYPAAGKGLKMKILSALGELGTPEAIALLKQEAANDADGTLQEASRYQLQKMDAAEKARVLENGSAR